MPRLDDDFRAPLESEIPVLFISGTLDGRTPISNATEIAEGFSNHRHLIVRNASHGGDLFTSSPKILEAVKMFLRGETLPWTEIDGPEWRFEPPRERSLEHEMLTVLDRDLVEDSSPDKDATLKKVLQGPFSDAMTHVGQVAMLRRMADSPVRGQNFEAADVETGRVGADQSEPREPFRL